MRMNDIIRKKRDGECLSKEEIRFFLDGYVNGSIPDYQVSALLMAIYFNGMTDEETADLTFAIRDSGSKADFSKIKGIRADKHSTGGVGDKTSMIVSPIVASLGVKVAKMSGRGLGHTGGTIDKLESIPGFKTELTNDEFIRVVNEVGVAIVGQSKDLAPADKKLYALRDVTSTVDSLPLIVSSIMGKKLAADDDCIVLDVKVGSGAFMKTIQDAEKLAKSMVSIGKKAGKKILALITDMDVPLGNAVGNALEVKEAVETLRGNGPKDLTEICLILASNVLYLAGKGSKEQCLEMCKKSLSDGSALKVFGNMVKAQGGDEKVVYDTSLLKNAEYTQYFYAPESGYITRVDVEGYGTASLLLGAGRSKLDDKIDYGAGIYLKKKTGDYVNKGDIIAELYSSDKRLFEAAEDKLIKSTFIGAEKPKKTDLVLETIE